MPEDRVFPQYRIFTLGLVVFFFYLNYFILIPRLLARKKFVVYSLIIAGSLLFTFFISHAYFHYIEGNRMTSPGYQKMMKMHGSKQGRGGRMGFQRARMMREQRNKEATTSAVFIALLLSATIRIAQEWYRNEKQKQEMEKEKLASELSFLKSQVNPHFLFNTLNGIYSLANRKSDKTPGAIVKLSDLMRYMLYESGKEDVLLDKEIEYIKNYIELQKLRLPAGANVSFTVSGETAGRKIRPMLLIPFFENAFKHGVDADGADIEAELVVLDKELNLRVVNRISKSQRKDESSGIGLSNIKKQLEYLYPFAHSLTIEEKDGFFKVDLGLKL
jgi:LytS/YehU family sensor histidine kinase